ncbi:MAG: 4-alpha-glucanotransferase, partial [Burkholderiaceae bacterium]
MNHEPLLRLAALKGIASNYEDVWGSIIEVSPTTLASLLVAIGALEAGGVSAVAIETAIAAHETVERAELLPPVLVLRDDEPSWRLPVRLPSGASAAALEWRIEAEDGSVSNGPVGAEQSAAQRPPIGYHALSLWRDGSSIARCVLIVAPRTGHTPPALHGDGRAWGAAAQLYALRSARNWGIGDYTDLARLIELWGEAGAGVVGVNPLHAMFAHNPAHASPYSPSSRMFLNTQYLDVEAIADFAACAPARELVASAAFQARLTALREVELVDHVGVAAAKRAVLELLYAHFRRTHRLAGSARGRAFDGFRVAHGLSLRRHALFEALQAHFHGLDAA